MNKTNLHLSTWRKMLRHLIMASLSYHRSERFATVIHLIHRFNLLVTITLSKRSKFEVVWPLIILNRFEISTFYPLSSRWWEIALWKMRLPFNLNCYRKCSMLRTCKLENTVGSKMEPKFVHLFCISKQLFW